VKAVLSCADKCHEAAQGLRALILASLRANFHNLLAFGTLRSSDHCAQTASEGVGLTLNGKSFPHTQPIIAQKGQTIRVRYMNEGLQIHPMHLHGLPQTVFAKDGWPLPQPYKCDTLIVGPGERWDVTVVCDEPGVWAFHCHILTHAESAHGMFGMVTALIIQ
jgi:FtsP/CotA-like multicopper oxidase with cupredoxin domain